MNHWVLAALTGVSTLIVAWTYPLQVRTEDRDTPVVKVLRVIDGDSFVIRMPSDGRSEQARLIGINSPEIKLYEVSQCYALAAQRRLTELIEGKEVSLMFDTHVRDGYKRLLVYAWAAEPDASANTAAWYDVGARLVQEGFARAWTLHPNILRSAYYEALDRQARRDKTGRWGACQ